MSRRSSKQRRAARRERAKARIAQRAAEEELWQAARPPLTPAEISRIILKYSNMWGRGGVQLSILPTGPLVPARNPEELRENTERALAEATELQVPS